MPAVVAAADSTEYQTTDLGLAAFLVTLRHPLTGLGGTGGGRRTFHFPAEARRDAAAYYQKALVPARDYFTAVRDLKALVLQP
jgi:hypothetical protein